MTTSDLVDLAALLALSMRDSGPGSQALSQRPLVLSLRAVDLLDGHFREWFETPPATSIGAAGEAERADTLTEMLVAEMLLRVWTVSLSHGIGSGPGYSQGLRIASTMTTAVLHHRRRLLLALLNDPSLNSARIRLDRTRRLMERWTDMLVAAFPTNSVSTLLRFDEERTRDYANLWPAPEWESTHRAEPLIVASMKVAMPIVEITCPKRTAAYGELVQAILEAVGTNAFDPQGRWKTWRRGRIDGPRDGARPSSNWNPVEAPVLLLPDLETLRTRHSV